MKIVFLRVLLCICKIVIYLTLKNLILTFSFGHPQNIFRTFNCR